MDTKTEARRRRRHSPEFKARVIAACLGSGGLREMVERAVAVIGATQLWLAVEAVDMRLGIDGLSLKIQESLGRSPCDGSAYAFRNRAGNRMKLLIWDGNGVWLCVRRLHRGRFTWPQSGESICTLSADEWRYLRAGLDWRRVQAKAPANWQV